MKHSLRIAHTRAWKRWRALPVLLAIALTFVIVASVGAAAVISATKTYTIINDDGDGKADPGETIEYTVAVANAGLVPGADDATGVTFDDNIDPNTTLVGGSSTPRHWRAMTATIPSAIPCWRLRAGRRQPGGGRSG